MSENSTLKINITITLIGAGHCPGSVMFLIEGTDDRRVLYTGDFRFAVGQTETTGLLMEKGTGKMLRIDELYLDTTFCLRSATRFPSRQQSASEVCRLITEWIRQGEDHLISLNYNCNLGCEFIYKRVSTVCGVNIFFEDPATTKWYAAIPELKQICAENPNGSRVHVHRRNSRCCEGKKVRQLTLSTMAFVHKNTVSNHIVMKTGAETFRVWYSIHSSAEELKDVVVALKPRLITANVTTEDTRQEINELLHEFQQAAGNAVKGTDEDNDYKPLGEISNWLANKRKRQEEEYRANKRLRNESTSSSDSDLDFGEDFHRK